MADAAHGGKAVTLGVVKINQAVRLYQRLASARPTTTNTNSICDGMRRTPGLRPDQ
jgi:hypothetical protein